MRRVLDALYRASAVLAALAMVGLLGCVLLSIVSRQLGWAVQGLDAYAGYLMAAAGFLALAPTLRKGEHIRVELLLQSLSKKKQRALNLWALAAGFVLATLLAWYSVRLVWQSYSFNDISTGNDGTPLWLPQLGMAAGTLIFALALLDALVGYARGEPSAAVADSAARSE
ncbi:MAG: TRAP transporter small permease [Rhodoferax sp.]